MRAKFWTHASRLCGACGERLLDLSDWCLARARRARRRPWFGSVEQDFD